MTPPLSRRNFLAAALAVPLTAAAAPALAVDEQPLFATAGTKYGVPPAVLAAFSYGQTRWEDHAGRPSTGMGYGPMHLIDGAAAQALRDNAHGDAAPAVVDTLDQAATLTGIDKQQLRTDPGANIEGAAAVLSAAQRALGHPTGTGTDPATWYAAIATTCGFTTAATQLGFADDVIADLRAGVGKQASGARLQLAPARVGDVSGQRARFVERSAEAAKARQTAPIDAPKGLAVDWVPAPYEQTGPTPGDYGNHDLARRPKAPIINQIVIHDMEGTYEGSITLVEDPNYLAWNYSVRSSDGRIAQHLETKDVGWQAGNWYVNMHSIGIEHEGYAVAGPKWFSEAMYRTSARLVAHLAREYDIPLDRAHIIGHDQVPATTTAGIRGMHWDPGPFWDWEHYFELLGAPLDKGTFRNKRPQVGDAVRILPGFAGNEQVVTGCDTNNPPICVTNGPQPGTNFVTLRKQPDDNAPLVDDIGLHPDGSPSTTNPSDISARASAGTDWVVAAVEGDWTAIWYLGQQAWFSNPASSPTARVLKKARIATAAAGGTGAVPLYGRAYPEASAYADPTDVQAISPYSYVWGAGQAYVVVDEHVPTDYYKAKTFDINTPNDHIDIVGTTEYLMVSFGHRVMFVQAKDVQVR
ncbi:N-acetylmuramoyl-L-alanine amidase [Flexivirga sp. ID2601S]|uniref:N-acetylmuramoyl-L-alanine amidase n=1 Tax=Flexivirga aerilata TaxID=1656889 RepID=A0A849AFU6_9MICO|nr:N-acetylmuramoyl-L-alanine amidase [Flexivirga aerilata]NNG39289.1 N-acetylmuramoyl-L-alanine amidase [Flexivirga aerilata]